MRLKTETNTPAMESRVLLAASRKFGRSPSYSADFEHGQWWLTHRPSGAQWSVVDTDTGFDFEQVTEGATE